MYATCGGCRIVGRSVTIERVFVGTLVENPSDLYTAFIRYKRTPGKPDIASQSTVASILSGAVEQHLDQLTDELDGEPTIVSPVPSTRYSGARQPLSDVIARVTSIKHLQAQILVHSGLARVPREVQAGLFTPVKDLKGERIVLIEDLWVRGTTAASALLALQGLGCRVSILSIGREVRRDYLTCGEVLDGLGRPAWW